MPHPVPCSLNWPAVRAVPFRFGREGCSWINDASIEECLKAHHLEDVSIPQVKGSHHAARIAALITLLRDGVHLDPIQISVAAKIWIADGNHRLRAYQYLGMEGCVPAMVWGHIGVLRDCFVSPEPHLPPVSVVPYYDGYSWWTSLGPAPSHGFSKTLTGALTALFTTTATAAPTLKS